MDALSSGLMCKKEEIWGFEQVLRAQLWWLGDLIGRQPLMTFGPAILVGVTRTWTTYTSIVEDFVMDTIFPDNCGPFDHNNAPAHRTKKWFRNGLDQSNMPPKSPDLCPVICGRWRANISIPGGPTFQTTKLPANILVLDTTAHLWGASRVHAMTAWGLTAKVGITPQY